MEAYYNRGLAKENKGDLDSAFADYDKAIETRPNGPDHWDFYEARGDGHAAILPTTTIRIKLQTK